MATYLSSSGPSLDFGLYIYKYTGGAGDVVSIPGLGRSSGEAKGYPLQYSGLENSMGCIVHGVRKTEQLSLSLSHVLT